MIRYYSCRFSVLVNQDVFMIEVSVRFLHGVCSLNKFVSICISLQMHCVIHCKFATLLLHRDCINFSSCFVQVIKHCYTFFESTFEKERSQTYMTFCPDYPFSQLETIIVSEKRMYISRLKQAFLRFIFLVKQQTRTSL